jgi:uncharacterized membrane protein YgdD (TMEM256/DUF423 family)
MSTPHRFPLLAAGIFGATGVALGAFGAHALRGALTELGTRDRWETAVFYQLTHTVALLGAAAWLRSASGAGARRVAWAARCWSAGVCLFSGGLYVMSITSAAPLWFKIVVPPLGGTSFIVGWLFVAAAALAKDD